MKLGNLFLALGIVLFTSAARAEDYDQQFSLTFDALGEMALPPTGISSAPGVGGSFFADWRPLPALALGTGYHFVNYFGTPAWQTSFWDLGFRIFPAPSDKGGELYIQGTLGLNTRLDIFDFNYTGWPGHFHGGLGAGYRVFVGSSGALDLGAQYDFYSPDQKSLGAIGVKAGWVFLFGTAPIHDKENPSIKERAQKREVTAPVVHMDSRNIRTAKPKVVSKPVKKTKKKKAVPAAVPVPSNMIDYTWVAGDQLESLAEAFLGRGNLYPLIVDVNKAALKTPAGLTAGAKMVIPKDPTEAEKAAARAKAEKPEYLEWAKVGKPY